MGFGAIIFKNQRIRRYDKRARGPKVAMHVTHRVNKELEEWVQGTSP